MAARGSHTPPEIALGASRGFIIALLLSQTLFLALIGVVLGAASAIATFASTSGLLPNPSFVAAIGVLAAATAVLASVLPAIVAARRQPITELRVP